MDIKNKENLFIIIIKKYKEKNAKQEMKVDKKGINCGKLNLEIISWISSCQV